MADISKELQAWKNARLGKDVRQAQIDLSTKINEEVEQNTTKVSQGIQNINTAVTRAETAAGNADAKAAAANSAAVAANAAAARAEGYVLGDITDKTVTYTEPATAGDIAPASGAKISAVVGWVVKRVKELGESIAGMKSKTPVISYGFGNIAAISDNKILVQASVEKFPNGRCNVHVSGCFVYMPNRPDSNYSIFSPPKLCALLGLNSITQHSVYQSSVFCSNSVNDTTLNGKSGLYIWLTSSSQTSYFGRIHTDDGGIGGWEITRPLYNDDGYFVFDIWGASYT